MLVYTAASLLLSCFILLSFFAGMSPLYIMLILILGNLGQTFMQISLSNTVSRTLAKDQAGVGMGLFSMIAFISGAASSAIMGKILDLGTSSVLGNPVRWSLAGSVYSSLFLYFALLIGSVALLYYLQFGLAVSSKRQDQPSA
ncbi:hypothetical protein ACFPYJ_19865 [Paenibacillus solisilvae]|uniref:Major facilitator superfamily (MFS) profile domain-containing protein n=1 Tax=Paenibacillus solisilvae TaxID=2486751 RepID=A0ABW0W4L5_9BACL